MIHFYRFSNYIGWFLVFLFCSPAITPAFSQDDAILQLSSAFRHAIEKVRPAVVSISAEKESTTVEQEMKDLQDKDKDRYDNLPELFKRFFPNAEDFKKQIIPKRGWQGSGVIISVSGEILTNYHVVEDADSLTVTLDDSREMKAEVAATDQETDLAIIRIKGDGPFSSAVLGDSKKMQVGDWVLAIGNPFGLSQSVSEGIISAIGRSISKVTVGTDIADYIQTTAAINPGNSGGPLVNLDGEVIGINNSIQTAGVAGNLGIGFAIPTEIAKSVVDNLKKFGAVRRGAIGILLQSDPVQIQQYYQKYQINHGAIITKIYPGQPAEKAGLQNDDCIMKIDGKKIQDYGQMIYIVSMLPADTEIEISVLRDGQELIKKLTLTDRSKIKQLALPPEKPEKESAESDQKKNDTLIDLGIQIDTLTPEMVKQKGYKDDIKGVIITEVQKGGIASNYDIKPGDVISEMNNKPIASKEEYKKVFSAFMDDLTKKKIKDSTIMLYIHRAGSRFHPKYLAPTVIQE